jgi:hypothetical protein
MNTIVKRIVKKISKKRNDCCFEVLNVDNQLILFANKGSVIDIEEPLNKKLLAYNKMLKIINIATAHIVPRIR